MGPTSLLLHLPMVLNSTTRVSSSESRATRVDVAPGRQRRVDGSSPSVENRDSDVDRVMCVNWLWWGGGWEAGLAWEVG